MGRRTLAPRREAIRLVSSWRTGLFRVDPAGAVLLPGPDARLVPITFDTWLPRAYPAGGFPMLSQPRDGAP